jgi:hypothetical protein
MIITPGGKFPRISVIVQIQNVIVPKMIISKVVKTKAIKNSMLTTMNSLKKTGAEMDLPEEVSFYENSSQEDDVQYDDYPELDIEYSYDYSF